MILCSEPNHDSNDGKSRSRNPSSVNVLVAHEYWDACLLLLSSSMLQHVRVSLVVTQVIVVRTVVLE